MKDVVLFRHQLFKASETFITEQGSALGKFSPIYLGRKRYSKPVDGVRSLALEDIPEQRSFRNRMWQVATRDVRPYIRLLEGHKPTLIHAHFGVEGVYGLPLAHTLDVPLVTTFHGFDATTSSNSLLTSGSPSWINYLIHRRELARSGDLFICVSEFIREHVLKLGFPEAKTRVHYIGVDTATIRPSSVTSERPVVLHVARLVEKKGTSDLLEAFVLVRYKCPEAELQIVGDGPLERYLRAKAESLGLGNHVHFLGALPHKDVLALMQKAWVFCLPSVTAKSGDAEGLGMVLLEAAACGVPVVATRHGGISEAVVHGMTGLLQEEHDVAQLAGNLSDLLNNAGIRAKMGGAARRHVESKFDLAKQSAELAEIYQRSL